MFLLHRRRVRISPNVHTPTQPLAGYTVLDLGKSLPQARVRHYWIDSYHQLFEKHLRYLRIEGKSRYESGARFSWFQTIARTGWELKRNLLDYRGLFGGPRGWFLSFFYAWYTWRAWLSLRRFQKDLPAAPQAAAVKKGSVSNE